MNPLCIYANYMLAECLKEALKKGEFTPTDFLSTDNELLKKYMKHKTLSLLVF